MCVVGVDRCIPLSMCVCRCLCVVVGVDGCIPLSMCVCRCVYACVLVVVWAGVYL